ncbi:Protein kinase domain [Trypanosoma melophagium]|uniref:Protein kinase domain n=1 Tax=Trypanosoma melophagium TaxID=715481 RepID=UPI00351A1321|nr:Protein kinase domain [Trypanosoma melophagium]
MGTLAPSFSALEYSNGIPNRDGGSTPTPAQQQQQTSSWTPQKVPETPAKQRRTVHEAHNEMQFTHISNNHRHTWSGSKTLRKSVGSRKRQSTELSQFSALQLEDSRSSLLLPSQDRGVEQSRRVGGGNRLMAPPAVTSPSALFPSQPQSPQADWFPRRGQSNSFIHASPERLEYSQADTEYSNFFNRRILTEYREVKDLGCGSFGKVTLYEETSTGNLVAVKVSPPLTSPEQRQRFVRERTILNLVRGLPYVVQLTESWEEGRTPQMYLQLEYCKGGSVADMAELRRRRGERWDERELYVFLAHMALALDALHSINIAHVDFKPENVLIDENGSYKLSDFGCSVVLNEEGRPQRLFTPNSQKSSYVTDIAALSVPTQLSIVSVEEGDCRYLCSDMLNQKQYLKAGDMFSFGISLFELMSGEPLPHHGAPFLELRSNPPVEVLERRGYSKPLVDLVVALMSKEPTARPTAFDVLRFFQLPPQAPQLVANWAVLANEINNNSSGDQDKEDEEGKEQQGDKKKEELLNMRFIHAALVVSSRLVEVARRGIEGKKQNTTTTTTTTTTNNNNNNNNTSGSSSGGVLRRARIDVDESCTPKTQMTTRGFNGI